MSQNPMSIRKSRGEPFRPYTYSEVAAIFDHDEIFLHYVIVRGNRILALRVREDYNPDVLSNKPAIWVGATPLIARWADILAAQQKMFVSLFVKPRDCRRHYFYHRRFYVSTRQATDAELDHARHTVPHKQGVSRIVFLDPVDAAQYAETKNPDCLRNLARVR